MERPNFVFVMTDSQGANVVGCYGRPELGTPCIDRLGSEGVRYARAYTSCPVCTPARAGIFTGTFPHTAGAWTNTVSLSDTTVTMGQRFRDAGYATAYVGKWHLAGHDYFDTGICPDGWDDRYWYDGKRYVSELSDEEIALWRSGLRDVESLRRHGITAEFTWAHRASNRGIEFLEAHAGRDEPFLLVVSYDEPHGPSTCPPEFAERFADYEYDLGPAGRDCLEGKPNHHREWADAVRCLPPSGKVRRPLYFGCNSFVDSEIGRVIDAVDRLCPDNTVVLFTSDHGETLCAHGINTKGPAMYEQTTHIPLIIRDPRSPAGGTVDDALISHVDLVPTMMELAGMDRPPYLEGRSFAARLTGGDDGDEREIMIEFNRYDVDHDFTGFQPIRCWMAGDYKLVINLLSDRDELYNLRDDPEEMVNLIDGPAHAAVRDRMHDALLDYMYAFRDPFRGPLWERRPWRAARRLGWLGKCRPRPDDGYAPPVLDYRTAQPNTGVRDN